MSEVLIAINEIKKHFSQIGIKKGEKNQGQGYNFRGIDQVMIDLSPQLAKHNLLMLPEVTDRHVEIYTNKKGTTLFYVHLRVLYRFISAVDGSSVTAIVEGEGMDSGDKATNKAMSAAYKYAAIQSFAIPVKGTPDADFDDHDVEIDIPHQIVQCSTPRQLTDLWKSLSQDDQHHYKEDFSLRKQQLEQQ